MIPAPKSLQWQQHYHLHVWNTRISPNLERMSCCSSRLENRILGFSPLMLVLSQGGASRLGLSLGSTSTSRFTWNKSGYFS